jgi:ABC-type transporter Mla subunit MlaD
MSKLRQKIKDRLDQLQTALREDRHLGNDDQQQQIQELISSVAKFWQILSDEERDFVHASRYALERQIVWSA